MVANKVDFTGVQWKSVEWTNLCLLYLRAHESKLARPILGDHVAAQDIERIDYDFPRMHRALHPDTNQFMVALRSAQFDAMIDVYLDRHPEALVLHLGCGLHSRGLRMARPDGGPWYDVDLPNVIALRRQLHSETERYRMVGSSVTDPRWVEELPVGGPVLIVAEGLLMYLTLDEVAALLHRLLDRFDSGELIADYLSPWGPRMSKIFTAGLIKWGTRDGAEVIRAEPRLKPVDSSPIMAGHERIPLSRQRLLYRLQYALPAVREYDRIYRYTFDNSPTTR
ncbi:class I SAM-dependent methyltransferase [Mycolicibacterium chlorophenolicum]|uniref:class I SAM-dependent methyltransferase n=1 Tax=Mycolicibacterium chlorophenolicum TaxID=37916 RepID=UPI00065469BB|nr:class I SAM-dependent methyltransferase [Mycolicibacterium chlorophenolicum]